MKTKYTKNGVTKMVDRMGKFGKVTAERIMGKRV